MGVTPGHPPGGFPLLYPTEAAKKSPSSSQPLVSTRHRQTAASTEMWLERKKREEMVLFTRGELMHHLASTHSDTYQTHPSVPGGRGSAACVRLLLIPTRDSVTLFFLSMMCHTLAVNVSAPRRRCSARCQSGSTDSRNVWQRGRRHRTHQCERR